jgi:dihydrolipoamide dehydrogenase
MDVEYDLIVLGAGPGGYVSAIRASQLGLKVAVVEREELGGVCLNWGCIPSKALLKNAEIVSMLRNSEEWGISFDNLTIDYSKAFERSRDVVQRQVKGVKYLFRKNNIDHISGVAMLRDSRTVEVLPDGKVLRSQSIVIATGARPRAVPPLVLDGRVVITSREALDLKKLPSSAVIIGGGATGVEFAYLWNAYGVNVTLVELLPRLVPNEDEEVSQQLQHSFSSQGISVAVGAKVTDISLDSSGARVTIMASAEQMEVDCDVVLVAAGVQANSDSLGLEQLGVATEKGFVTVDSTMATNVSGVYAIGDVTGKLLLAHVASAQGHYVSELIAGLNPESLDYQMMPRATYCNPQVASFGLTESQARENGYSVKVGRFPFQANGKAHAIGEGVGMAKLVVDAKHGDILGAHLLGPEVTELLAELSITRLLEGTTLELGWMVHAHPTLSEVLKEAAMDADGRAIHV